jgi:hypothetical protein
MTSAGTSGSFVLYGIPPEVESVCVAVDGISGDRRDRAFAMRDVDLVAAGRDSLAIDLGERCLTLECGRSSRLPSGRRLRLVVDERGSDHPWLAALLGLSASSRFEFEPGARYRVFGLPPGEYRLQGEDCDLPISVQTAQTSVLVD